MLGALEAKQIQQLSAEHRGWRPIHSAVIAFLLAHRSGRTGLSSPSRTRLAEEVKCSLRTVTRALSDLKKWGIVEWEAGGVMPNGLKYPNSYFLLAFPLYTSQPCESVAPVRQTSRSSATPQVGHPRPLQVGHSCDPLSQVLLSQKREQDEGNKTLKNRPPFHERHSEHADYCMCRQCWDEYDTEWI